MRPSDRFINVTDQGCGWIDLLDRGNRGRFDVCALEVEVGPPRVHSVFDIQGDGAMIGRGQRHPGQMAGEQCIKEPAAYPLRLHVRIDEEVGEGE